MGRRSEPCLELKVRDAASLIVVEGREDTVEDGSCGISESELHLNRVLELVKCKGHGAIRVELNK